VALDMSVSDRREGEHVRLSGSGRGGEYGVDFTIELDLGGEGERCTARWRGAVTTGVLSSLAQRVLPAVFAAQVERVLRAAAEPDAATATA